MNDLARRLSATVVSRYRPHLFAVAAILLLFHFAVLLIGIRDPNDQVVAHLVVYSQGLLGFTGALLLLFLLSQTVHALKLEEVLELGDG